MRIGITEIIIVAAVTVLLIIIIAAKAKKKNLNRYNYVSPNELDRIERELNNDHNIRQRDSSSPNSETGHNLSNQRKKDVCSRNKDQNAYSSLLYYVYLDGSVFGPYTLEKLKTYPLLEDTLITTDVLKGSWYEAKYFECLDELFSPNLPFRIDADGVIIRLADEERN